RAAPPESSPLALHDALPISADAGAPARQARGAAVPARAGAPGPGGRCRLVAGPGSAGAGGKRRRGGRPGLAAGGPRRGDGLLLVDRKSTRLNSSHVKISYAV